MQNWNIKRENEVKTFHFGDHIRTWTVIFKKRSSLCFPISVRPAASTVFPNLAFGVKSLPTPALTCSIVTLHKLIESFYYFLPILRIFRFTQICCLEVIAAYHMPPAEILDEALELKSLLIRGLTGRVQPRIISPLRVQISVTTNHSLVAISVAYLYHIQKFGW